MAPTFTVATGSMDDLLAGEDEALFDDDGSRFSLLKSFSTVIDGYYSNLSIVFEFQLLEENIAEQLEKLSTEQLTILNEVTAYRYNGFDEANESINVYSIGYNGLNDPAINMSEDEFLSIPYSSYTVSMDMSEISGLHTRYGTNYGSYSVLQQIQDSVSVMALEVLNSYTSKRMLFNKTRRQRMPLSAYGSFFDTALTGSTLDASSTIGVSVGPSTSGFSSGEGGY